MVGINASELLNLINSCLMMRAQRLLYKLFLFVERPRDLSFMRALASLIYSSGRRVHRRMHARATSLIEFNPPSLSMFLGEPVMI